MCCQIFSHHFSHDIEQALHALAGARAIALDSEHGKKASQLDQL
ncbi:hypothetical protein MIZ03_2165 [Rhodoferax lithotrophicus]|uniref:Uncharacterized protein n=1 Tax=Rhodoferax lithotrophicus TaxID=2798804 RepID=A0ABN6D5M0_9BURK|nr:hypothetical protein MIZ03_2165 [Rhodoferax sp. MIZ03]